MNRRHLRVGAERGRGPFEDHGAVVDDVDAVGELEGHFGVLLDEEHADVLVLELADGVHDGVDDHRGEALGGLIQKQEVGAGHEGAGDGEHFLFAARKFASFVVQSFLQARKALEHGVHLPARALALGDGEVLARGEVGEDAARLGDQGDAALADLVGIQPGDVAALVENLALLRRREAGDAAQRRGLAGAVATEERDDLAFGHAQRQAVKDVAEAVVGVDAFDFEDQAATPPRYARRTSGFFWISSGVPSAIRLPKCITEMRSETLMMMSILCSMSTIV